MYMLHVLYIYIYIYIYYIYLYILHIHKLILFLKFQTNFNTYYSKLSHYGTIFY